MECFNTLLLKLREVHEREVEGWQVKIQELSNKKGCDTKRMEELFTKNQQMKEQQRLLTDNIKTLENRLRAGLCDRCTVTQEVAKRRQQEFEASHIQSIQHISVLAGEMNNLKTENKRLRDEVKSLKATLKGHSDRSSNGSTTTEVKSNSSPELSNSSGPVALVTPATSRANKQPPGGDVAVKTEQRVEGGEHRQWRGASKCHYDSYKPLSPSALTLSSWKTECVGERAQNIERLERRDQQSSIPPHALLIKNCSLSTSGGLNPSRHVLHTPVPCRPQPIKSTSLQWPLTDSSDWVSAAPGTSLVVSNKLNMPRFPNLIPTGQHGSSRRQGSGSILHKEGPSKSKATEPTVLFRLKNMTECLSSPPKPQEKKETPPPKPENLSGEGLKEMFEGPLDLSDRGKSKSSASPRDCSPATLQAVEIVENSPDEEVKTIPSTKPAASPHPVSPPMSSSPPPVTQKEEESTSDENEKQAIKEQKQKEEVKKVPVLTISLRPVVVLETLKSAQQKHDLLNDKSSPAVEMVESSSDEQGEEGSVSGQESNQSCKRKRASVETETDRDSDTDNIHQESKIKVTARPEENSPS